MTAKPWLHNPTITIKIQDAIARLQAKGVTEITAGIVGKECPGVCRATIEHRMKVTYDMQPIRYGTQINGTPCGIYSLRELAEYMGC